VKTSAGQRLAPVCDQVTGAGQEVRPGITHHGGRGFPDHGELAVVLDLADQHRLGEVVIGHHGCVATGEVGNGYADDGVFHRVHVGGTGFLDRFDVHIEADVVGFHRVVGDRFLIVC